MITLAVVLVALVAFFVDSYFEALKWEERINARKHSRAVLVQKPAPDRSKQRTSASAPKFDFSDFAWLSVFAIWILTYRKNALYLIQSIPTATRKADCTQPIEKIFAIAETVAESLELRVEAMDRGRMAMVFVPIGAKKPFPTFFTVHVIPGIDSRNWVYVSCAKGSFGSPSEETYKIRNIFFDRLFAKLAADVTPAAS